MTILEPSLTAKSIREVLKKLGQFEQLPETPLAEYVLIQQQLNRPEYVKDDTAVARAVFDLIVTVITDQFVKLRALFNRPHPNTETTYDERIAAIESDAASNNDHLMAASSIYYQYLVPELGLDGDGIDAHYPVTKRTMQRWRDDFFENIRLEIIRQETAARLHYRQKRCKLALPQTPIARLDTQEQTIRTALGQLQSTKAVMLYGPAGSGKTVCAVQIAKRSIDLWQTFGEIVWLRLPDVNQYTPTAEDLLGLICDKLHIRHNNIGTMRALQGYLTALADHEQLLLILDSADGWMWPIIETWPLLGQCWVIVTASTRHFAWSASEIGCLPITLSDTMRLLTFLRNHFYPLPIDDDLDSLSEEMHATLGGNIGQIKQAYRFMNDLELQVGATTNHTLDIARLSIGQQQLLLILGYTIHNMPITYGTLSAIQHELHLASTTRLERDILTLQDGGYVQREHHPPDYYYHPMLPLTHLLAHNNPNTAHTSLMDAIIKHKHLLMSYNVLASEASWTTIPPDKLRILVQLAHHYVKQQGLWQAWLWHLRGMEDDLHPYPTRHVVLLTEKAATLRWLGQLQDARHEIDDAIAIAEPYSLVLADALLERSRIALYMNVIDEADAQWAGDIFNQLGDQDGIYRALTELARLWFHIDPDTAERYLSQIPQHDIHHLALLSEIKLGQGLINDALTLIRQCLRQTDRRDTSYARLLHILAQVLFAAGHLDDVYPVYENAINYAQQAHYLDMWGLARLYNNFAAMLIRVGDIEAARMQLQQALILYDQLQDDAGRQAAQDNLNMLSR